MKTLRVGDVVDICGIRYSVDSNGGYFYLSSRHFDGHWIFKSLGIKSKTDFQEEVLGYWSFGGFPYCNTLEDLTKLVEALINYKNMEELPDLSTEFIVDCADNEKSVKEVANWLTTSRGHVYFLNESNSFDTYEAVVCKKYQAQSLCLTIDSAIVMYPHLKVYTFEQFKKAIDMENSKKERKIIGYKAPFDMYDGAVSKGETFIKHDSGYYTNINPRATYYIVKEIVENTFVPVYEQISKDKIFTLRCSGGTFELKVTPYGIFYEPENAQLNSNTFRAIINPSTLQDGKYRWWQILEYVDLGCKKRVPVEDIRLVLDYYEKIRK